MEVVMYIFCGTAKDLVTDFINFRDYFLHMIRSYETFTTMIKLSFSYMSLS